VCVCARVFVCLFVGNDLRYDNTAASDVEIVTWTPIKKAVCTGGQIIGGGMVVLNDTGKVEFNGDPILVSVNGIGFVGVTFEGYEDAMISDCFISRA